ncbi:LysR family transcriptional regulator [uncultured Amphritea sp.]|uniref:LysR family transcriptional regulator n=1 Tax=uncultured Amphritea sp. TaxID=981605 RepID=UPI0025ECEE6D|nr:LysR family transcriptional regulator [uncultured Amphritea sp.]
MKLNQLKYFLRIAELGSVSAAARELFIAQPALSNQVSALEKELEVELFVRTVKGVQPTPAGEKLVHHAGLILRQVENARADVISDAVSPRGEVRLVVDASKAYTLLPLLVTETALRFPEVQLNVSDAMSLVAAQHIADGKVDLGLIPNAADLSGVEVLPVYRESMYLVGKDLGAGHDGQTILFEELADYPLVAPSRPHNIRMHIEQTALEARRPLDIRYEQNTGLGLRCLINNGIASAIIPWDVMSVELQRGELDALKVIQPSIDRIHSLVRLEDRPVTTACRAVEGLIIELISTLCEQHLLDGEALVSPE